MKNLHDEIELHMAGLRIKLTAIIDHMESELKTREIDLRAITSELGMVTRAREEFRSTSVHLTTLNGELR